MVGALLLALAALAAMAAAFGRGDGPLLQFEGYALRTTVRELDQARTTILSMVKRNACPRPTTGAHAAARRGPGCRRARSGPTRGG
jgi:hypothetical protein